MTKERSSQIVNFMTPGEGDLVLGRRHIVEMQCFFSSQTYIRQTKYIVMMTKDGSTKIINFMNPGEGFLCQGVAIGKIQCFFSFLCLH